jgi:hypothetical protein
VYGVAGVGAFLPMGLNPKACLSGQSPQGKKRFKKFQNLKIIKYKNSFKEIFSNT